MGIDHQNEILKFTTTEEIQQNGQNRQAGKKSSDPASVCSHNPKHKLLQVLGSKYAYIMLHHK